MTPESKLKAQVELYLSELGYIPLRLNVFQAFTHDGIPIRTGLSRKAAQTSLRYSPERGAPFLSKQKYTHEKRRPSS